jgi:hypothetical protein
MRLIQRICKGHPIHPAADHHVRFANESLSRVRMIRQSKLMHSTEVLPNDVELGGIGAGLVESVLFTQHFALRAD